MKRLLQLIGVVVVVLLIREGMKRAGGSDDDPTSRRTLKRVAAEANKSLPRRVDSETELTRVEADKALLIYHYRLVNQEYALFDAFKTTMLKAAMTAQACRSATTRQQYIDRGTRVRMNYVDKNGQPLTSVLVSSKECADRTS